MSNQLEKIKELIERRAVARIGGGEKAIAKQHEKGKYTARERLAMLLDEGSFEEMDMFVEHRCTNFGMEKKHCQRCVSRYGNAADHYHHRTECAKEQLQELSNDISSALDKHKDVQNQLPEYYQHHARKT